MSTPQRKKNIAASIFYMAQISAQEFFHEKVLWMTVVFSGLIIVLSFAIARLSFYEPSRLALDFGLAGVFLASCLSAVILGAGLISKDMRDRTAHLVLTKPISRPEYVLGRFLGAGAVIILNSVGMYFVVFLAFKFLGGAVTKQLIFAPLLQIMEFLMLLALSMFFSSFTTAALATIFSVSFWFIGHAMDDLSATLYRIFPDAGAGNKIFITLLKVLPDFTVLSRLSEFSHHTPIPFAEIRHAFFYGMSFVILMLCLTSLVFWKKDI